MLLMLLVQGLHLKSTALKYGGHSSSLVEKNVYQVERWG